MPTVVSILTFMNRKNSIIRLSEPKNAEFLAIFILMSDFYTSSSAELSMKKGFITSRPGSNPPGGDVISVTDSFSSSPFYGRNMTEILLNRR